METIAIANQKGGAGKTSVAVALWGWLNRNRHPALAIDLDAQCNLTYCAGADVGKPSIFGVLSREAEAKDAIQRTAGGDIMPASKMLATADQALTETGKEYRLGEALRTVAGGYEYAIVDTPPHMGVLTINALQAARSVIIPTQADIFSLAGIGQLWENMQSVKKYCQNPGLAVDGILLTRYSPRTTLSRQVQEMLERTAEQMGTRLYKATIREAIAVKEAQIERRSIFDAAPRAKVTADYLAFIQEFMQSRPQGKQDA